MIGWLCKYLADAGIVIFPCAHIQQHIMKSCILSATCRGYDVAGSWHDTSWMGFTIWEPRSCCCTPRHECWVARMKCGIKAWFVLCQAIHMRDVWHMCISVFVFACIRLFVCFQMLLALQVFIFVCLEACFFDFDNFSIDFDLSQKTSALRVYFAWFWTVEFRYFEKLFESRLFGNENKNTVFFFWMRIVHSKCWLQQGVSYLQFLSLLPELMKCALRLCCTCVWELAEWA